MGALARPHGKRQKLKKGNETYPDGGPQGQMRSGAGLKGVTFSQQLRLDFQEQLI